VSNWVKQLQKPMLCKAYSNYSLSRTYVWQKYFQNGRILTDGDDLSKPLTDCIGSSKRDKNTHWLMSHDFSRRFRVTSVVTESCAKALN
jgi:hypothetical protein